MCVCVYVYVYVCVLKAQNWSIFGEYFISLPL